MNNSHRLLFIVYYFEDPHSFVDKLSSVTFFLLISSRALLIFINSCIDSICTAEGNSKSKKAVRMILFFITDCLCINKHAK